MFTIHTINPTVQEVSEFNCRGELIVAENQHDRLKTTYDVKMGNNLKKMVALNGNLDLEEMPQIAKKFELHPN